MKTNNLIISAMLIFLVACHDKSNENNETFEIPSDQVMLSSEQIKHADIEYGSIQPQLLSSDVDAKGLVLIPPDAMADVVSLVSGVVKFIPVQPGDHVKKGEIIALIGSPEYLEIQQDFITAFNSLKMLKSDYERQKVLNKGNAASAKKLQEAEAGYNNALAEYTASKEKLKILGMDPAELKSDNLDGILEIRSLVSGVVDDVFVNLGKYIEPSDVISRILYNDYLLLEIMVFEKDIEKVKTGQRITFRIGDQAIEHEARVSGISASVKSEARVVKVLADFQNKGLDILPGMFISARIHTSEDLLDALPDEAILFDGKNRYYFFYSIPEWQSDTAAIFKEADVKVGFREDGYSQVEPVDKLPKEAMIVVRGAYYINAEKMKAGE